MDFGIGYRWRTHESNLLLSVRLPDGGSGRDDVIGRPPPRRRRAPKKPTAAAAAARQPLFGASALITSMWRSLAANF